MFFCANRIFVLTNNKLKISPKTVMCYFGFLQNRNTYLKKHNEQGSTWIERLVEVSPKHLQPYMDLMRLDRPNGIWLLYLPCTWGIALGTPFEEMISVYMLGLFGIGATLMRGAGCTINDMWDKDFDKHVDRTKNRPITSGAISIPQAFLFLGLQSSISLLVLLQFNWYSVALGLASSILVISYPLFKRFTYWPQLVLGFTFNYGALLGYSAVAGSCSWPVVLPLYITGCCWTLIYDTIYALQLSTTFFQDVEDDKRLGLKSTAIYFADKSKQWLSVFGGGMGALLALTGYNYGAGPLFYVGASSAMMHVAYQIYTLDIHDRQKCSQLFKSNRTTGLLVFSSIALDRFFHSSTWFL